MGIKCHNYYMYNWQATRERTGVGSLGSNEGKGESGHINCFIFKEAATNFSTVEPKTLDSKGANLVCISG